MKSVLFLSSKPPLPVVDGGTYASNEFLQSLISLNVKIHLFTISTPKHPFYKRCYDKFSKKNTCNYHLINTNFSFFHYLKSTLKFQSYNLYRFIDNQYLERLKKLIIEKKFDYVIFDSLYTAIYTKFELQKNNIKFIYRAHNVEWKIWNQKFRNEKNILKKVLFFQFYKSIKKTEEKLLKNFDCICSISSQEQEYFKSLGLSSSIILLPISIKENDSVVDSLSLRQKKLKLYQIAAFNWEPNIIAMKWFIKNVWSELMKNKQDITLHLVGKGVSKVFCNTDIIIDEKVKDNKNLIESSDICVVPLFLAGGSRVKIIEAMGYGKCVICTELALGDIPAKDGKEVLIAKTDKDFINKIKYLKSHPKLIYEIGKQAKSMIFRFHGRNTVNQIIESEILI